jgi:hypothetical protein
MFRIIGILFVIWLLAYFGIAQGFLLFLVRMLNFIA